MGGCSPFSATEKNYSNLINDFDKLWQFPYCFAIDIDSSEMPVRRSRIGQLNSPESREMLDITEMTENFTKVTKHLTKLKETLINYV